ncbi:hypothetical protein OG322_22025 [Streptomyces sp. NBC_01260]|uniref:hypothetical protein n=1 Tax=unclassified Streptomyces TaxID=2593676 RepID=UPI000FAD0252|nr:MULTISPECIES: hypothetical protein [unclassified Streptomyces]ROQ80704.1 hypothetical protein EDD95_0234 [Streptomyces sp. CEV 2-1]RPK49434.1 hypothetical protein EES39_07600 [Streptomyces sp. ADI92-24]
MTRTKIVAAALLTLALAVPTATAAAVDAYGGGAHGWTPATNDSGKVAVKDNSSDGDPVKAEYYRTDTTETKRTLWNHSGPGTTSYSADGARIYKFQVCDENYGTPDDCSGWKIS